MTMIMMIMMIMIVIIMINYNSMIWKIIDSSQI